MAEGITKVHLKAKMPTGSGLGTSSDANNSEVMKDPVSNKSESEYNDKVDTKVNDDVKKNKNDLVIGKVKRTAIKWKKWYFIRM